MSLRTVFAVSLALTALSGGNCFGRLLMGMDAVGWENANDSGPLLFRNVNDTDLVSVRAKITAQSVGNWSQAGVIVRAPNAIDAAAGQENWQTSWSFRAGGANNLQHQSNAVTLGVEAELNDAGFNADALQYMRLDRLGPGQFQAYRGSGPNDANITWTVHNDGSQTNANLVGALQVGVAAGASPGVGGITNARVAFEWIEIQTTSQTFRDDFTYTHDFTTGVPVAGIWSGVENAALGGTNTVSNPRAGECIACTWAVNGSGNINAGTSWGSLIGPNGNDVTLSFGAALAAGPGTAYTNTNVTVKKIEFNNAVQTYAVGGAGTITLDADTGDAFIDVLAGSHEIQTDLIFNDNVMMTAAAGTTLNVNAGVFLNGKTFTIGGAGTILFNNGTFAGSGPGAGAVVNDGTLAGLAGVQGDYTQTSDGSLAVRVGGAPIQISGAAQLGGVLDVSLADGFAATPGSVFTVLTADSVSDLGLSLAGADAGLFHLAVGNGAVSLVVGAVPEPSTLVLVGGVILAGCAMRRRRGRPFDRGGPPLPKRGIMSKCCTWTAFLFALYLIGASPVQAQFGTFRDDFGDDAEANDEDTWDYTTGTVPAGGIWNGIHNPTFGDGVPPSSPPARFISDGSDGFGADKTGKLFIEDLNLHLNPNATLGVGWEGNKNNAPFLFRNVPADAKFTATMKIDAQTAGQWSYAPIIARLAGNPVGIGLGDPVGLDPDESFVTMGSFRTDTANPGNASMLTQNIVNTVETEGPMQPATNGLPLWIQMQKVGAQFTAFTSIDGIAFTQRNQIINTELATAGETLEVGPSFMMFTGGGGNVEYDFFEITVEPNPLLTQAAWSGNAGSQGSGDWGNVNNWSTDSPGQQIDVNTVNVTLGTTANVTGPTTVFNNTVRKVKSLAFDSVNKYAIAGPGGITMEADLPAATTPCNLGNPSMCVLQGSHEIQVDVTLNANTTLTAAAGTRLDFNNQVDFVAASRSLTVTGGGKVNFNNNIDLAALGAVNVNSTGVVGGSGRINGTLNNNSGGTVAPGTSAGTLTVDGNYVQNAAAALNIEIGGTAANAFDKLVVGGALAVLGNGTLNVSLINGFVPSAADSFQILFATNNLANNTRFINTTAAPNNVLTMLGVGTFKVNYVYGAGGSVTLTNFMGIGGVPGDYNGNGVVDTADYVVWRNTLGTSVPNGTGADGDGNGTIQDADYTFWKARFGNTSGSGSGSATGAATIPEPTSIALLLMAAIPGIRLIYRRGLARFFA